MQSHWYGPLKDHFGYKKSIPILQHILLHIPLQIPFVFLYDIMSKTANCKQLFLS